MAITQITFLAQQPFQSFQTRGGVFTADANGVISNIPLAAASGPVMADLINSGCIPIAGSPSANFRNLLDGGDFTVNPWQRNIAGLASGGVISSAIANTATYFPDRFFAVGGASSSILLANVADTTIPGFGTSCLWTRSNSNSNTAAFNFGQLLEPADMIRTQGSVVTFSFYARQGANYSGGNLTAQIISGTGNAANNTAANLASGGLTGSNVVATAAIPLTLGMTRFNLSGTVPVGATQLGVLLTWTPAGTAGAQDGIFLGGLQLEVGGLSAFEHRDIQVETEICQRYCWVIAEPASGVVVGAGSVTSTNNESWYLATPVQMAKAPTVTTAVGSFKSNSSTGGIVAATGLTGNATHTPNAIGLAATGTGTAGQAALLQGGGGSGYIMASADY